MVHTAAASNLGQMLLKLCLQENIDLICVVRSVEQAQLLQHWEQSTPSIRRMKTSKNS